jgi:hypothetical protein
MWSFEDDTSFPMNHLPLILFPKGLTFRFLLRTSSWNCVPKKAIGTAADAYADGKIIETTETRFKFLNSRIITSEIVLSSDMQAQIYNKIGDTGMIAYPCV